MNAPLNIAIVGGDIAGVGLAARTLVAAIASPSRWALYDIEELPHYVHGRAALLGDAAHAMLPHQGAGAGQGLEDAWFLRELLADPLLEKGSLGQVLQVYERWRLPYPAHLLGGRRTLRIPRSPGGRRRGPPGQTLARRFDWLWQHDLLDDVREARQALGWTLQPA